MGRQKSKIAAEEQAPVQREKKYTFADIRKAIFKTPPKHHTLEELKEGIEQYIREKHARR